MGDTGTYNKLYSLSEIDEIIKNQKDEIEFTIGDVVLLLLYADEEPIKGKIRQMKEVFLALKEILPKKNFQPVMFEKKQFGPYSEEVEHTIEQLTFANYVEIIGNKISNDFVLKITSKGALHIKKKFDSLPENIQIGLKQKREEWDSFIPSGIIHYVYIHNEEFLENSVLKNRYKKLDWADEKQKP